MFSGKIEDYILFEDKEIIVCRKPAGIAVQNARIGAMDLESSLKNYLAMQDGGGRRIPYLAVIHRLDQPVEGILVFGKTPEAAKSLSAQITAGKMEKIYLAVTYGKQAEAGKKEKVLEDYLKKDGKSNTSSVVNAHTPGESLYFPMRFSVKLWMQFPERKNGCFEFIWIQAVITRSGFRWLMQECLWLVTGNMVPERM